MMMKAHFMYCISHSPDESLTSRSNSFSLGTRSPAASVVMVTLTFWLGEAESFALKLTF